MPRAEEAARQILSLPVHADLTDTEVDTVADCIAEFFRR
jgi:dTDP-4-amino-4,6-dideoxygalactose transaminase